MSTCTCGHDESLHESPRATYVYAVPCRRIGCPCTAHAPAPAGVSAAPTTRDRPIGPAGAALYSEDRCDNGHVLDCCGNCKCEGTQHE